MFLRKNSQELFKLNSELTKMLQSTTEVAQSTSSRLESVVNNISEVIFQMSNLGELLYLSPVWEKLTDFTVEQSIGSNIFEYLHPSDIHDCQIKLRNLLEGTKKQCSTEVRFVLRNGSYKWCELVGSVLFDNAGHQQGITGSIKNISARKVLEKEKKKSEEKFQLIFEKSSVAYLLTKEDRFIECNHACLELFGVEQKHDFIGKFVKDFSPEYQPDGVLSAEKSHQLIKIGKEKGFVRFDWMHLKKDGREFPVEVTLNTVPLEDNILFVVLNDLSERKKVESELVLAKEKAEEATRAKAQFLSTMSHEIRTPMNAVIGITHLLSEDNPREDQINNLNILKLASDNLMALINDILDFSKIEAGRIELESIDFNFRNLIKNVLVGFELKSQEKGLLFRVDIDPKIPVHLKGDPTRISQILSNLCGNAIKFTDKGSVTISIKYLEKKDQKLRMMFEISDTGIGIPDDKVNCIFDSFSQADSNTTRLYGGTGLGLTISKKLVEVMNGDIGVKSKLDVGTTFYFDLELQFSTQVDPCLNYVSDQYYKINKVEGLHILLADDNPMNIMVVKQFLNKWGISYEIAENGLVALEKATQGNFDMILMDLQMPEMDGYDAARSIRSLVGDKFKNLPIIAVTASAFNEVQKKITEAGMNDFVLKPINPEELYVKIEKYAC